MHQTHSLGPGLRHRRFSFRRRRNGDPGQESREGYQPLDEFADEVMALFAQQPTPPEILVQRVAFLRNAEREGRFDETFQQLNQFARQVRGNQN